MSEIQHPDRALEAIARRQHGVFDRQQALLAGCSSRMIDRRLKSGSWIRLDCGVYALGSHPFTWIRQVKAAELSLPGCVVSHRAAAVLHGVPGFRNGRIDVTVEPGSSNRSQLARVHRRPVAQTALRQGIIVTTLERTVFDLAGELAPGAVRDLVHDLVVRRMTSIAALEAEHSRLQRSRPSGLAVVRGVIDITDEGRVPPGNDLERALKVVLDDPRLPAHESQAPLPWWTPASQRVDELIPSWRRIVEADGRLWHTREADFERDRARDHLAQRHGYDVTRFTYGQLVDDPDYAIGVLLEIGRSRRAA